MEEDIKILEEFIKYFETEAITRKYSRNISITVGEDDIQAIENLLKEYKDLHLAWGVYKGKCETLEARNKELEEENNVIQRYKMSMPKNTEIVVLSKNDFDRNIEKDYISKDKIREKIEELKEMNLDCDTFDSMRNYAVLILQELMEEKENGEI